MSTKKSSTIHLRGYEMGYDYYGHTSLQNAGNGGRVGAEKGDIYGHTANTSRNHANLLANLTARSR